MENEKHKRSEDENGRIDLTPKKKETIVTSKGTLYARYLSAGDLEPFSKYLNKKDKSEVDLAALGKLSIQTLVGPDEGNKDIPMSNEVFDTLTAEDIENIAAAVAKANDAKLTITGNALSSLGEAIFSQWADSAKQISELSSRINRTLNSNFASVSAATHPRTCR